MATSPSAKKAMVDDVTFQRQVLDLLSYQNSADISSMMGNKMVELFFGLGKHKFIAHEELICNKVPYFEKMFKNGFTEAQQASATFPEYNVEAPDQRLRWICQGTLKDLVAVGIPSGGISPSRNCIPLYARFEMLRLPELQDRVMDAFSSMHQEAKAFLDVAQLGLTYI